MSSPKKMALSNGANYSSTQELLDAQAHVWNHIYKFINSMSLKCAVELGIPDAIHKHGKPMTLAELSDVLPINKAKTRGLYRLLRILVHSKFFDTVKGSDQNDEAYCLTPASRLLLRDEPLSIAPLTLALLNPVYMDPFQHLGKWFKNDDSTPFLTKHGKTPFEFEGSDPNWNNLYNDAMASDARLVAGILVKECGHVFEGLRTMVDVGGGTGMFAKTIADAIPGLKCIVLELPHVIAGLEELDNLSFVSGDMRESVPQADAVLLKWTLNMWTHEEGVKVLQRCREAIDHNKKNGGKVIIVDMVVGNKKEDHEATETQILFDVLLMGRFNGGERTEKEWEKLFTAAGFTTYKITPVLGLRSVIEV
ncbi:hypothetical protein ACS0TY_017671 [Phlomoides rotata]